MFGFIIVRHINSQQTNLYWQESYNCIRKYYDNMIIIIDDNSKEEYVSKIPLVNAEIIKSEFPGRAELLPYYYLLKHEWFDTAIIIHDSVFIQKPIKFDKVNRYMWHFTTHAFDNVEGEVNLIEKLSNNKELLKFYKSKKQWFGCFGVMSVITYDMIDNINSKYNFFNLLKFITCRKERMMLERVFGMILTFESGHNLSENSYFGNIEHTFKWGFSEKYTIENYNQDKKSNKLDCPIVKLWTGR